MYLDLDVILAELKDDDWLASAVDTDSIDRPKTSVATGIELLYDDRDADAAKTVLCCQLNGGV